jgi:hypothetical protein
MKRKYYPNDRNWPSHPNSENSKQKQEQKPKDFTKVCCMECGSSHGTLHKIKKPDGTKGYLCNYCFESYEDDNYN